MLNVANKPFMLSGIVLNVIMLCVIMLNVVEALITKYPAILLRWKIHNLKH